MTENRKQTEVEYHAKRLHTDTVSLLILSWAHATATYYEAALDNAIWAIETDVRKLRETFEARRSQDTSYAVIDENIKEAQQCEAGGGEEMERWKRYTISNPVAFGAIEIEAADWEDTAVLAAGFSPGDPDIWVGRIVEWEAHPEHNGHRIVGGLNITGHAFAVER